MKNKKFTVLREWNRRRNYFMKMLWMNIARLRLDHKKPKPFDLSIVKRVMFLRDDDKIGDMVVSTSLFREFGHAGYQIDVLAGENNAQVIECNPYIHQIIVVTPSETDSISLAKTLAQKPYDLVVDMGDKISPARLRFLKYLEASNIIGFNKSRYNIYNKSLDYLGYNTHITARYALLLETLAFKNYNTDYDLHYAEEVEKSVGQFIDELPGTLKIALNPFTADNRRDLSQSQLTALAEAISAKWPHADIIIIGVPSRINTLKLPQAYINPFNTLSSAIAITRHADLVITPDTSIVHIATAWKKPLVCLYGNDMHGKFVNSAVWGPGNTRSVQLLTKDKDHHVSTITVEEIVAAIETLI